MVQVNVSDFSKLILGMSDRLGGLLTQVHLSSTISPSIASEAFKELGVASEELQVAAEELHQQNDSMASALDKVDEERRYYHHLFEFAPEATLITDLEGTIQEANRRMAQLLGMSSHALKGKPFLLFVGKADHSTFWVELTRRQQCNYFQEWRLRLETCQQEVLEVACSTVVIRDDYNRPIGFQWNLREVTKQECLGILGSHGNGYGNGRSTFAPPSDHTTLFADRAVATFHRGDLIPLPPKSLWYVKQGLAMLTTLTEQGKEVLTGLCGTDMVFGNYLTVLPLYEAKALSEVQLVSVSLSEIAESPSLIQLFFSKTSQRLRQTEVLLAISGQAKAEYRLLQLFQLLKNEVGQPVAQGVRLSVRLTHEDLASACGSTRVTITRLLGKLQRQGKLAFDKQYIILRN